MKFVLKMLFAPIVLLLWLICGVLNLCLKISAVILNFGAILFAAAGAIFLFTGSTLNGCIGFVIAFLLCPYGIPLVAALLLARLYVLRYWFTEKIYG